VIIPCRNEMKYISSIINSVLNADCPIGYKIRIYVIDGMSTDGTTGYIKQVESDSSQVLFIQNKKKILAAAWNLGVDRSIGEYVCALNAHAEIPKDYFTVLLSEMAKYNADAISPILSTLPQGKGNFSLAVSNMMSSPFGVGNSSFRTGVSEARPVETGHCLIYKRYVFDNNRFNEDLVRSQDIEFNKRLVSSGYKIYLTPKVAVKYYTRTTFSGFVKYGFLNGYWVSAPWSYGVNIASTRHLVPMIFVIMNVIFIALFSHENRLAFSTIPSIFHLSLGFIFSLSSLKVNFVAGVLQPFVTLTYHILYGVGTIFGSFKAIPNVLSR